MTEYCIKYSLATGLELARFSGPEGISSVQFVGANEAIILVSASSFGLPLADVPIAEIRSAIWDRIKARRDAVEYGGASAVIAGSVHQFDTDERSQNLIGRAVQLANELGEAFADIWTMADDQDVAIDQAGMLAIGLALGAHISATRARGRDLRIAINAAEDIASLLTIDIASGWPA